MKEIENDAACALLEARGLFCERDERLLFENLSFSLNRGEVMQVEGANGSGKTTLLRYLAGLSSRCDGDLLWQGSHVKNVRWEFAADSLYIGHDAGVKLPLTAIENLRWYCSLWQRPVRTSIEEALQEVGLRGYEDVPAQNLSAGQRRRIGLARLYLSPATLWILDEPFTAIDKAGVARLETLVAGHAAGGGAVLLTTHHALSMGDGLRRVRLGVQGGGEQ